MKQILSFLLLMFLTNLLYAQEKKIDISTLNTIAESEIFIQTHPGIDAELFSMMPGEAITKDFPGIFTRKNGYTFKKDFYRYKIVGDDSVRSFRVSYIFLDGSKYSKDTIDKIRTEIIRKYKEGAEFKSLVTKYNMDSNPTGDTDWFGEKLMVPQFENAVKAHNKGEIFTVDTPGASWYHVVLKTHSDTYKRRVTLLKVKSSR